MPEPLEILVGGTPNPHAVKVTLNRTVASKGETYRGDPAAVSAPWAKALLGIPGVVEVFGLNNFISVKKTPDADWEAIIPKAEAGLREAYGP